MQPRDRSAQKTVKISKPPAVLAQVRGPLAPGKRWFEVLEQRGDPLRFVGYVAAETDLQALAIAKDIVAFSPVIGTIPAPRYSH